MELLGMLQHMASWQFLSLVAILDVCLILMHIISPSPFPLFPSPHADPHARLLDRISEERERAGKELRERVREMKELGGTLRGRADMLRSFNATLTRLEESILRLKDKEEALNSVGG